MNEYILLKLGIILFIAVMFAWVLRSFKLPTLIAYLLTGLALSPFVKSWINDSILLDTFSHIGISLLLFIVGLYLNPKIIKEVGKVSVITGVAQFILTATLGAGICIFLGFTSVESAYIAIGITFSSTIVVMKMLSDNKETETLFGRIAIGFMIVQDVLALIALIVVSAFDSGTNLQATIVGLAADLLVLGVSIVFVAVFILPKIVEKLAASTEILFLFSLSWMFLVGELFLISGLSLEAGALVAGVALSLSPYRVEIAARMRILRDFFILMFFVILGSRVDISVFAQEWVGLILLSLFIILGIPLLVTILVSLFGYAKKTAFYCGLYVSQISEFSLIFVAVGVNLGHVSESVLSFVTLLGIITMMCSAVFVTFRKQLFHKCEPLLKFLPDNSHKEKIKHVAQKNHHVILIGCSRIGTDLLSTFQKLKHKCLVIDYNPATIKQIRKKGIDVIFGDASEETLLDEIEFHKAKMVASTIADEETSIAIIKKVRRVNKDAILLVVAHRTEEALRLYELGATYVIMPHFLGGRHTSLMVEDFGFKQKHFLKERFVHIEHLKKKEGPK